MLYAGASLIYRVYRTMSPLQHAMLFSSSHPMESAPPRASTYLALVDSKSPPPANLLHPRAFLTYHRPTFFTYLPAPARIVTTGSRDSCYISRSS